MKDDAITDEEVEDLVPVCECWDWDDEILEEMGMDE